jgi:hypothetical protein
VLVIDGLRRALADAKGPLGLLQVCDRLSRLHVLAMATRTAVLLVDNAVYPPERPRLLPPDGDLTLVEDPVGAGLAFADAHGQLECVWRLWRRPREPLGLLTSLDGAEAQIVRVPLVGPLPGKGSQGRRPRAQGRKVAA